MPATKNQDNNLFLAEWASGLNACLKHVTLGEVWGGQMQIKREKLERVV